MMMDGLMIAAAAFVLLLLPLLVSAAGVTMVARRSMLGQPAVRDDANTLTRMHDEYIKQQRNQGDRS